MKKNILKDCPICGKELSISKLKCEDCDMEYSGDFEMPFFSNLNEEEMGFVKDFLRCEGNISHLQNENGKSYATIKALLHKINVKLRLVKDEKENVDMKFFTKKQDSKVIKAIQDKFLACGGAAKMPMLKGAPLDIWVLSSGEGIGNSGFSALICEWDILDAIVKKANELGGRMYRGDTAAQSGAKIGSSEFPLNTIDAFIALEFYNGRVGESTTRRSTYYAAILAWAGIVENHRSTGQGGYITVKPEFRK